MLRWRQRSLPQSRRSGRPSRFALEREFHGTMRLCFLIAVAGLCVSPIIANADEIDAHQSEIRDEVKRLGGQFEIDAEAPTISIQINLKGRSATDLTLHHISGLQGLELLDLRYTRV